MTYVDVHAHYEDLDQDFSNYSFVILNGTNPETNEAYIQEVSDYGLLKSNEDKDLPVQKKKPHFRLALGFHPLYLKSEHDLLLAKAEIERIKALAPMLIKKKYLVAIGEIGLDYFHIKEPALHELQKRIFIDYLLLAEKLHLPVIIHARNSVDDVLQIISDLKQAKTFAQNVILHCFEASETNINKAIALDCYFTIPPAVVRNELFQRLVSMVKVQRLLTETDAPYQSPKKGIPVIPSDMKFAIDYIAKVQKLDSEELEKMILANYLRVFF